MDTSRRKRPEIPFYALNQDGSGSSPGTLARIHDRIVGETRAAVRALQTARPFTALDRSRGLLGYRRITPFGHFLNIKAHCIATPS